MIEFQNDQTQYFQCELVQDTRKQVAWIEERGAKVGNSVEVKDGTEFWNVTEVYPVALAKSVLKEMQRNNRNSLPSILPLK